MVPHALGAGMRFRGPHISRTKTWSMSNNSPRMGSLSWQENVYVTNPFISSDHSSCPDIERGRVRLARKIRSLEKLIPRWPNIKWATAVYCATLSVLCVLVINVVLTICVTAAFGHTNGIGTAYKGSCKVTGRWTSWLHAIINVLSSILLACSNYCMQLLVAPTRHDVDRAHSKGAWLDIGVPSLRNLRFISAKRVAVWAFLALSSLPLHLL